MRAIRNWKYKKKINETSSLSQRCPPLSIVQSHSTDALLQVENGRPKTPNTDNHTYVEDGLGPS